jgi:hypothetical protein
MLLLLNLVLWAVVLGQVGDPRRVWRAERLLREVREADDQAWQRIPPHRQGMLRELLRDHGPNPATLSALRESLAGAEETAGLSPARISAATAPLRAQFVSGHHFLRELARGGVTEEQVAAWLIQNRQARERAEARLYGLAGESVTAPERGEGSPRLDPGLWRLPKLRRARHIFLIAPESGTEPARIAERGERMEAIARRLDTGGDFAALAREYSEDEATRRQGGLLPWFTLDQLPPVLRAQISRLHPGDVAGPFYEPALGWHLVRMEEILPARQVRPEEVSTFLNAPREE